MTQVKSTIDLSGWLVLTVSIVLLALFGIGLYFCIGAERYVLSVVFGLLFTLTFANLIGLFVVDPNQATALLLFGDYRGTIKTQGLRWSWPFFSSALSR